MPSTASMSRGSPTVSCEDSPGCPRPYQGTPVATIKLFGTRVTVSDDGPHPEVGGPLTCPGWRRPGDVLTYDTSDNTAGIRAVRLEIAGQTRRVAASSRLPPPPSPARAPRQTLTVPRHPGRDPERPHGGRGHRRQRDRGTARQIKVDGTPPTADLERARGKPIVIAVTDAATRGVATARIGCGIGRTSRTRTCRHPRGRPAPRERSTTGARRHIDMRVTVRDAAGLT